MDKLDETKPYGFAFVDKGKYFGQEGRYFDMSTRDEVILDKKPTGQADKGKADPESVTCKYCGKQYKLGKTDVTRKGAVTRMKNHLEKEHSEELKNADTNTAKNPDSK